MAEIIDKVNGLFEGELTDNDQRIGLGPDAEDALHAKAGDGLFAGNAGFRASAARAP